MLRWRAGRRAEKTLQIGRLNFDSRARRFNLCALGKWLAGRVEGLQGADGRLFSSRLPAHCGHLFITVEIMR